MSDYTVYGFPLSPFVRKVEAFLRNRGVDYNFENINIMNMPHWFLEMSPARRIPIIFSDLAWQHPVKPCPPAYKAGIGKAKQGQAEEDPMILISARVTGRLDRCCGAVDHATARSSVVAALEAH